MSQTSITSFFARSTPKETKNDGASLSTSKTLEGTKRGRESSQSDESPKIKKKTPSKTTNSKRKKVLTPKITNTFVTEKAKDEIKKNESSSDEEVCIQPPTRKSKKRAVLSDSSDEDVDIKSLNKSQNNEKKLNEPSPEKPRENSITEEKDKTNKEEKSEEILHETEEKRKSLKSELGNKKQSPKKSKKELKEKTVKSEEGTPKKDKTSDKSEDNESKTPKEEKQKVMFGVQNKTGPETKTYNPESKNYHPVESATWQLGEKIPYSAFARTLEEIENVSSRLRMIEILSNYFRSAIALTPEDLIPSVYLCLNKLAPAYEGMELGIAETSLMKAISQSTGRTVAQIKADAQETGDLGIVAEKSKSNQRMIFQPVPLMVRNVFVKLKEIAKMSGNAAQTKKVEKIQSMFVACKNSEARFLIRSLAGKLRVGLAEQSALQALALACAMTPPDPDNKPPKLLNQAKKLSAENFKALQDEYALILKTTYCECPNYDMIIPVLLKHGIKELPEHCKLTPGIPLKPMLAHPTKGVQEVLSRFEGLDFTCEWKYDGERAQIHMNEKGEVNIYSRNQENNTSKYPDIINRLENCKQSTVQSFILDCEAVAWDKEKLQILPFQILSTRKRKDANEEDIKVQVCVFMFDLLYLNGEPLVKKPFLERRKLLKEHFKQFEGQWQFATSMDTKTVEEVQEFLEESVKGNCEGLMVKTLSEEATYEIAKRSRNWLKLKKDYLEGVGDTLDVVVIGGYVGKGKRTGTYGGFLLACYDAENEEYQSICKIGTGFTDEHLQTHAEFFKNHKIDGPKSYYRYDTSHEPDHWFDAVQVWEIKCADLSLSPVHRAAMGLVDPDKGISLRFPRFIRVRDDKTVEEATSAQQVADMYSNQDQIKNQAGGKATEDDFY